MSDSVYGVLVVIAILVVIALVSRRHWQPLGSTAKISVPVPFAKVIDEADGSAVAGFGGLMLAIFSFGALVSYMAASTVLQEIAALLIWIGSSAFWGLFIIGGILGRGQTHVVYSELATNLEKNIARLEKMQEQGRSASAVADAVQPGAQLSAEELHAIRRA